MMKKILSFMLLGMLFAAPALALIDDFDAVHNYKTDGVAGTGWDNLFAVGGVQSSLQIQSGSGKLRLQSQGTTYNAPWDMNNDGIRDVGPSLTVSQTGDFVLITRFLGESGTSASPVFHQSAGLIARNPDTTSGENVVLSAFFPVWTGHITWNVVNDVRTGESGSTVAGWADRPGAFAAAARYCFMKLERTGNQFRMYISQDGVNWLPLVIQGPAIYNGTQTPVVWTRNDMPETIQIGLFHAIYEQNLGWSDFDFVYAGRQVAAITQNPVVREEGQTSTDLTITLTGPAPSAEVQVKVIPYAIPYTYTAEDNDPNDILLVGSEGQGLPLTVTFPVGTTQQTITVKATEDALAEGLERIGLKVLTYSTDPAYDQQLGQWTLVTVIDNEQGGLEIGQGDGLVVDEDGLLTDTFTVSLTQPPANDVTVSITTDGQTTVNPASLTFTTANYSTPKTVSVKGVDDAVLENDPHVSILKFSISSEDAAYNGVSVPDISVQVRENECGAWGYSPYDENEDCVVNLTDLSALAAHWMECTLPNAAGCLDAR